MSNRTLTFLMFIVILGMGTLLLLNFFGIFFGKEQEKYLSQYDVRGMAVEWNGKLWTLNFEQQKQVVSTLNQSIHISNSQNIRRGFDFGFEKLHVYRFDQPDLVITPVSIEGGQLIYSLPEWNPNGLMRETGVGELQRLLMTSHDA